MKNKMRMLLLIIVGISMIMQYACSDDKSGGNYDGPLKLNTFYPDSGYLSSKIILEGENFGTDASKLSVYFNEKKGYVSQAAGNILMVYAPKLPGENCKISVVKGEETAVFDDEFRYISRFTVDNVCGNANDNEKLITDVDLASTRFTSYILKVGCCDPDGNYYATISTYSSKFGGIVLISEKNNLSKRITKTMTNDVMYHKETERLYATAPSKAYLLEIDPSNDWKVKNLYLKTAMPPAIQVDITQAACIAYCSANDYFYARTASQQLFRFKLDDLVCEYINTDKYGTGNEEEKYIVSMMFDPEEPTKLYTSYGIPSVITVQDITDLTHKEEVYAGHLGAGRPDINTEIDGYRTDCWFKWNNQMAIISEKGGPKTMYIADAGTHTIRKIDMKTGIVTTAVGLKFVRGNQSGTPSEATFNGPKGVGVTPEGDLYISDSTSGCVRKLSLR